MYTNEKIDLGHILWALSVQRPMSSSKDMCISCAQFWSIVVKNARDHFKVSQMTNVQMTSFSMMNILTFVAMNANNFHYTGSIQEVMLYKVLANNEIIDIYKKTSKPCERL